MLCGLYLPVVLLQVTYDADKHILRHVVLQVTFKEKSKCTTEMLYASVATNRHS